VTLSGDPRSRGADEVRATAAAFALGWCRTADDPQPATDGEVVRFGPATP
jgi:hypothetical protein